MIGGVRRSPTHRVGPEREELERMQAKWQEDDCAHFSTKTSWYKKAVAMADLISV